MKHQDDASPMGAASQGVDELAREIPSTLPPSDTAAATFLTRPETLQALRQQTHILQSILHSMSDGVVVADEQGKILLFNPAAERMVGLSSMDNALSERSEHYRPYLPDGVTPFPVQDLPLVRAIRGEAVDECEIVIRHANKPEHTWLSVNARPLVNEHGVLSGGVAVYRDITVHQRTEDALRQQKAFAESVIETAQAIVLVLDRQGQIVSFNPYTEELTGYPLREVQGKDWFTFFLPEREQLLSREVFDQTITNQLTSRAATALRTRAGKEREIKWSNKALRDSGGAIVGMLAIGHDITDLKNAQQQLLQAERLAAIGQMIAGLAHESRNALQRTQACLEMLVPLVKDRSRALAYTAFIQEAQDDLQHLFNEVRGFAAPIVLQQQECDLREILQQAWTNLAVRRNGRSVRLREKANTQDLCVEGDPFQLERVFRNILENSFDAGPDSLKIIVSWSQAGVDGRSALQVVLRDNGQGLSREQQERIFEPFYTTKTHGTGLGMAIVKRIVEAHGGRITVGSGRNGGAKVQLLFPRRKS